MNTPVKQTDNRWFIKRRDMFVKNMLKEFYETFMSLQSLYEKYLARQQVSFADIDQLVGTENAKGSLWRLKDRCHQLWRDTDPAREMNGCLLDWIMGSVFHEAMKLKENIYMYQYYGPLADEMKARDQDGTIKFCGVECQRFMERTVREINRQVDNLGFMFGRANYLLRTMMPDQAGNVLLVRYLVENEPLVDILWSESLPSLFSEMFGDGPEYGFCVAARSYAEGHWYDKALKAYGVALDINRHCDEARRNIVQLQAMGRERDQHMNAVAGAAWNK